MPPKKKILVIDDDKLVHVILKAALEKGGYQVFAALDAMQGLMSAKQLRPDLIILDMLMPAGGGESVYERLQMMSASFQVPILVYSSMDPAEIAAKITESDSVKVLAKGGPPAAVLEAAKALLGD